MSNLDYCAICGNPKKDHKDKDHKYTEDYSEFLAHRLKEVENQVADLNANMFPLDPHLNNWKKPWPKRRKERK